MKSRLQRLGFLEIDVVRGMPMCDSIVIDKPQVPAKLTVGDYQISVSDMKVSLVHGTRTVERLFHELVASGSSVGIQHGAFHIVPVIWDLEPDGYVQSSGFGTGGAGGYDLGDGHDVSYSVGTSCIVKDSTTESNAGRFLSK